MIDLGPQFGREADHLGTLLEERDAIVSGRVPLGVPFLDDCLGGIFPKDLLVIGAGTGVGKTELAVQFAMAGVAAGLKVYGFFLEAEVGEVAARLYYRELARLSRNRRLDFGGWWRGGFPHLDEKYGDEIRAGLAPRLSNLHTLYKRRGDFTLETLNQQLEGIASEAEMVILDHIHMVGDDDEAKTIQLLRDMALDTKVPCIAISHVRKRQTGRTGALLPDTDDLYGSSNLSKVGTQIVLLGRDWNGPRPQPHLSPTLVKVEKDRKGRAHPLVARVHYDLSKGRYENAYELGSLKWKDREQHWLLAETEQVPHWALNEARNRARGGVDL